MRHASLAIVREEVGPFELLNKQWIIDPDGNMECGSKHGRSTIWSPAWDTVEVRRDKGLAVIVQGFRGDEYDVETAVLRTPDPAILVVVQPSISRRTVKNMIHDVRDRDEQALVIVGADMPGVVPLGEGSTLLVDCDWDDHGTPILTVTREP